MARWKKVRIQIPKGFKPSERRDIAQDIIEFIQDRAIKENKGFNPDTGRNKKFPKYSKHYAEKVKKTSRSDVDLVLEGEMFSALKTLNDTSESVTIGFDDQDVFGKAEGNHKGSYNGKPDSSKARPFLGIQKSDLNKILEKYGTESS